MIRMKTLSMISLIPIDVEDEIQALQESSLMYGQKIKDAVKNM